MLKMGKIKNKMYKKGLTTTIKFFILIMLENIVLGNEVFSITFLATFFLVLQDIWNEEMKHQLPYKSALVLSTSYFDPKYLAVEQVR